MAAFDTLRPHAASGRNSRLGGLIAATMGAVISWNDARMTRKALSSLSDKELDDIGLIRGDIETVSSRY